MNRNTFTQADRLRRLAAIKAPDDEQSEAATRRVIERKADERDRMRGGEGAGFRVYRVVEG